MKYFLIGLLLVKHEDQPIVEEDSPKTGARMDDPVTCGFLPDPFLHECFLATKELHSQFIVRRLEQGLKLILQEALLDLLTREARARLFLRRPVEGHIVHSEVDLSTALVIHLVACNTTRRIKLSLSLS